MAREPPIKTLVYTTAFGDPHFFELAEQSLTSLRGRGYDGDIAVITDRKHAFPAWLQVNVCVAPHTSGPRMYKSALPRFIDGTNYDRILFVDSDVVFIQDPAPLFSLASTSDLAVSVYHHSLKQNVFNQDLFSEEERRHPRIADIRAINTGIMVFTGTRFHEYMELWENQWYPNALNRFAANHRPGGNLPGNARRGPVSYLEMDQPAMQALMLRAALDYEEIPDNLYLMPMFYTENDRLHPDAVALHLCGGSRLPHQKLDLVSLMKDFASLDSYEMVRERCDHLQNSRSRHLPGAIAR